MLLLSQAYIISQIISALTVCSSSRQLRRGERVCPLQKLQSDAGRAGDWFDPVVHVPPRFTLPSKHQWNEFEGGFFCLCSTVVSIAVLSYLKSLKTDKQSQMCCGEKKTCCDIKNIIEPEPTTPGTSVEFPVENGLLSISPICSFLQCTCVQ